MATAPPRDLLPCPRCGGQQDRRYYGICSTCAELLIARSGILRGVRYLFYGLANKSLKVERD